MEMDILQEVTNDKFKEIFEFLQKHTPISLIVLNLLKSFDREDPSKETELKVFCPEGDISSGVVIVTLTYLNKCGYKFVKVYCCEGSISILKKAISETRRLEWTRNVIFEGLHSNYFPIVEAMIYKNNIPHRKAQYKALYLPTQLYDSFHDEVTIPPELIIRPLTSEDATLIDETWHYHTLTTYDYIHHSIVFFGGLGLVNRHTGQLVSWAIGVYNYIGIVYTMPDYRHRGYAQVVIKALTRKLIINNNVQPACLIRNDNTPSVRLFETLGFVDGGIFYCMDLE